MDSTCLADVLPRRVTLIPKRFAPTDQVGYAVLWHSSKAVLCASFKSFVPPSFLCLTLFRIHLADAATPRFIIAVVVLVARGTREVRPRLGLTRMTLDPHYEALLHRKPTGASLPSTRVYPRRHLTGPHGTLERDWAYAQTRDH